MQAKDCAKALALEFSESKVEQKLDTSAPAYDSESAKESAKDVCSYILCSSCYNNSNTFDLLRPS